MRWKKLENKAPKQSQWVVVPFNGIFRCGQFDAKHPFGPVIVDHKQGKWWQFTHWAALTQPKNTEQ